MKKEGVKLYDLVDLTNTQSILNEIKCIITLMADDFDHSMFEQIYADIKMLFKGNFPGYRASNTKYHDLEHTSSVVLAAGRLIHGAFVEGYSFSAKTILLGLIGAIFHDIGFIQTDSEVNGTGAKHTIGHEERSIHFMKQYFSQKPFSEQDLEDCAHIIMCTILNLQIKDIPFRSNDIAMLGKIVGSADLLAQMADRDLYQESIVVNINYLKTVVDSCDESCSCYLKYLRRGGLAEKLNHNK